MDALNILVRAIGWTLIHSLWLGALSAAVYAVFGARLRNQAPQSAYAFGLACLLTLVLGLGVAFAYEFDQARVSADERAIAVAYAALPIEAQANGAPAEAAAPMTLAAWIEPVLPLLVLLWGIAVLGIGSGLARTHLALRRLVGAGVNLPQLAAPVIELARAFGVSRPIAVVSSACARVPFVIGHFAPVIVLPLTIAAGMPWPQLRLILAHEIAHLRRADYLVNWLQLALEVLLFFHPAVRWLSEEMRSLREACCDDLVVAFAGGRADYTRALLSLEEFRHDAPLLAPSAVAGGLLWRVQRIAGRAPSHRGGLQKLLLPGIVLGLFVSLVGGGVQLRPGAGTRDFVLPRIEALFPQDESATLATPLDVGDWQLQPATPARIAVAPPRRATAPVLTLAREQPQREPSTLPVNPYVPSLVPAAVEPGEDRVQASALDSVAMSGTAMPQPQPIHSQTPTFPRNQRALREELAVDLSYQLDANGQVIDIQAKGAPAAAQAFVKAASDALAQWRFQPADAAQLGDARLQHRFVFRDGTETGENSCNVLTGTKLCVVTSIAKRDPESNSRCESTTGSRLCRR